jgi:2-methylisocitrate lyase-like PEP mutase family enzyme
MNFKELHQQREAVIIGNVWDVASACIAEQAGYQAIGTSSAAIASTKGLADGELVPFDALLSIVKDIVRHTSLPITVDIEGGYSRNSAQIVKHIIALAEAGVKGVNIEDSVVDGERVLLDPYVFSELIANIKKTLNKSNINMFINVRTDTFLLGVNDVMMETKQRINLYEKFGADGLFIPCIEREQDISAIVTRTRLPLNVMCMPNLPSFDRLNDLGVKRISMGNFVFDHMMSVFQQTLKNIKKDQSFRAVF